MLLMEGAIALAPVLGARAVRQARAAAAVLLAEAREEDAR